MVKALMVMGSAAHVGKSVIALGRCRLFYRRGLLVAPVKAQGDEPARPDQFVR